MSTPRELFLVANARMPSQRAQSVQVAQVAAAFSRAGVRTTLLHARRFPTPALPPGQDLFDYYAVGPGPRPVVEALPCIDWIDRVPTRLQFVPARVQELSFARAAAKRACAGASDAVVVSREAETARALVNSGHARTFLEVHRVPGGRTRRRWLLEAARRACGVVAISSGVAEDLYELGVEAGAVRVEHDGMESARLEARPERAAARSELGLDPDAFVAVYTGGLLGWKGVEVLVDAARMCPQVQFVIAGGMDTDVARLREYAAGISNVRLDGFQAPGRVPIYLAAGDVGCVPNRSTPAISARYTSPLKVFESLAAGLPMVASDLPSLRDVLTHEEDALLVAPDDARALAEGIQRMRSEPELAMRLAKRGLERAPGCTWDARAQRLLAWFDERTGAAA